MEIFLVRSQIRGAFRSYVAEISALEGSVASQKWDGKPGKFSPPVEKGRCSVVACNSCGEFFSAPAGLKAQIEPALCAASMKPECTWGSPICIFGAGAAL